MNPLRSVGGTIIGGTVLAVIIAAATSGINYNVGSLIVWFHVLAGITWIGLLYYFNFVQVPALGEAVADEGGPGGAGIALSGAGYLGHLGRFQHAFTLGMLEGGGTQDMVIGVGAWFGTIMLFNVWVLIWPNQKKILGMVEASAEEIAKAKNVAFLASRTNTFLSIPMIMSMVGYGHGGFFL
jgi:uncharacterized membrane protein